MTQATVSTTDNMNFRLINLAWDGDFTPGAQLDLHFQSHFAAGTRPNLVAADMDGQDICGGGGSGSTSPTPTTTASVTTTASPTTTSAESGGSDCSNVVSVVATDAAQHTTDLSVRLTPSTDIESWVVDLRFSASVDGVESPLADVTGGGASWKLASKPWDGAIQAGQSLELMFTVRHVASATCPAVVGVTFSGTDICIGDRLLF